MKSRLIAAIAFYFAGWAWNAWLWPHGGPWGDWLVVGRWIFCIGDLLYLFAFALLLAIPFRRRSCE